MVIFGVKGIVCWALCIISLSTHNNPMAWVLLSLSADDSMETYLVHRLPEVTRLLLLNSGTCVYVSLFDAKSVFF